MTTALSVSGLSFAYRDSLVLRGVALDLPQGVGPGVMPGDPRQRHALHHIPHRAWFPLRLTQPQQ